MEIHAAVNKNKTAADYGEGGRNVERVLLRAHERGAERQEGRLGRGQVRRPHAPGQADEGHERDPATGQRDKKKIADHDALCTKYGVRHDEIVWIDFDIYLQLTDHPNQ